MASHPQPNLDGEYPPLHGAQLVLLTIALAMATFMEVLDMTIVNVSIPHIAGSLGVSPSEGTWTVSSYSLAAAIAQPLSGWIGRRFGEVRSFAASMLLFVAASALCGFAVSMNMLVIARLIQGLVSGPMVAVAQALLLRNYPPEKRGTAMAMWGMVVVAAPLLGPILGGWITDNFSWPWLFYINLPVGLLAVSVAWSILHKRESKRVIVPIDSVGLVLLAIGVGSLQYMLDNGNEKDWFSSPLILAAGIVAVVAIVYLVAWELTDKHPILDLHLFKHRNFTVGSLAISLGFFCLFGTTIVFPLWLQTNLGYTAQLAGLAMAPVGVFAMILSPIIGGNIHRLNLRIVASLAFMVFSSAMLMTARLTDQSSFWQFVEPRVWQGVGVTLFFLPLNQMLMSDIRPNELAAAAGLSNFLRTLAGSTSAAISIFIWNNRIDMHRTVLTEHVRQDAVGWTTMHNALQGLGFNDAQALGYVDNIVSQQATTLAANDLYTMFAVVLLLLIPLIWMAKPPFVAGQGAGAMH